jgi:hypothetical protein
MLIKCSESEYYQLSAKKIQEFQVILRSFVKTLKTKKLDQRLSIELKDPKEYRLEDIITIATKLYSDKEVSDDTRSCMRVIRKCFQVTAKHKSTLSAMLKFVPNDSYGSVIVGGFTLILAVSIYHSTSITFYLFARSNWRISLNLGRVS